MIFRQSDRRARHLRAKFAYRSHYFFSFEKSCARDYHAKSALKAGIYAGDGLIGNASRQPSMISFSTRDAAHESRE